MNRRRFPYLILIITLLTLATHPLLAQDAAPLTQTSQATDAGLTLSVSYPAGWAAASSAQGILIGSNASALDELQKTGLVKTAGETGVIVSLPNFLDNLNLPHDAPADEAVKAYLEKINIQGTIAANTDFGVPAATTVITPPDQTATKALLGALQFPDGTVIIGVVPYITLDATMMAILNSITLEGLPDIPPVTPDPSVSLTPASFNFLEPNASVTLSLGLPDGWVSQYSDHAGLLYLGNSDSALAKSSQPGVTFEPGEVAITIALPHAVVGLGIPPNAAPADAISHFQTQTQAQGRVVNDDSFAVPAAHARLTGGNLPDGGGDVYMLKFDDGPVFVVVQPTEQIDGTVMAILQSIHLGALGEPAATPETQTQNTAKPIRQWANAVGGSSEYGADAWSFGQATGKPNNRTCGDSSTAWASKDSAERAVLKVSFAQPVIPSQINIYQTFNPGSIVEVDLGNNADPSKVLPLPNSTDPPGNTPCPGIFSLNISGVTTPIDFIVIYIDQSVIGDWDEIDAVELVGTPVE